GRIVESAQAQAAQSFGEQHEHAESQVVQWQIAWAEYLLGRRENQRAAQLVASFTTQARKTRPDVIALELRIAARTGNVPARLAAIEEPVPMDVLRGAAAQMAKTDAAASRRVLEFVYNHELKAGSLDFANFTGLAEIRLQEKNTAGAMTLLRRM